MKKLALMTVLISASSCWAVFDKDEKNLNKNIIVTGLNQESNVDLEVNNEKLQKACGLFSYCFENYASIIGSSKALALSSDSFSDYEYRYGAIKSGYCPSFGFEESDKNILRNAESAIKNNRLFFTEMQNNPKVIEYINRLKTEKNEACIRNIIDLIVNYGINDIYNFSNWYRRTEK